MKRNTAQGFTVLELLVILGIITILIGLVLVSLNAARRHSNDERKVASVKTIALGLREYFNICRTYPATLTGSEDCPALSTQVPAKTLKDVIPGIADFHVDGTNPDGSPSKYHYISLVDVGNPDPSECTNFHLWVTLDADGASFADQKSNVLSADYGPMGLATCTGSLGMLVVPPTEQIFDIKK